MNKITREKEYMGTLVEISIDCDIEATKSFVNDSIEMAFSKFDYVIKKFSRFDPNSELSILNKSSGEWFEVSAEIFYLIELALKISKKTHYLFDPTIIDILKAYGYDKSYSSDRIIFRLSEPNFQKELKSLIKSRKSPKAIKLDKKNLKIKLVKGQKIDLGSIAKGYAIDLAGQVIKQRGFPGFLINAGGDILVGGQKIVALFDPRNGSISRKIKLKDQAIAGSGNSAKQIGIFKHIIDLNDKNSDKEILQTYVIAPSATIADGYATALFLTGDKSIMPKGVKGIVIK